MKRKNARWHPKKIRHNIFSLYLETNEQPNWEEITITESENYLK